MVLLCFLIVALKDNANTQKRFRGRIEEEQKKVMHLFN